MCFLALSLSFWVRFLALAYWIMCFLALSFSLSVPLSPHPLDIMLSNLISFFLSVLSKPRLPDNALSSPPSLFVFMLSSKIERFLAPSFFFFLSALSNPYFKYFQKDSPFLDMASPLSLISFSSLQSLPSKVSYETFYRKHCKEEGNCNNLFFSYSPKFYPFFFF
jgi:hypothetical protein